jgi:hypothetical protein
MFRSGTLIGGGRSLNWTLPLASRHFHWAMAGLAAPAMAAARAQKVKVRDKVFTDRSVGVAVQPQV